MNRADEPLEKVTLFLYASDMAQLRKRFGWGWSKIVRDAVRRECSKAKPRTLGEMIPLHFPAED